MFIILFYSSGISVILTWSMKSNFPKWFHSYPVFSLSQIAPSIVLAKKLSILPCHKLGSFKNMLYRIFVVLLFIPSHVMSNMDSLPSFLQHLVLALSAVYVLVTTSISCLPQAFMHSHLSDFIHSLVYLKRLGENIDIAETKKSEVMPNIIKELLSKVSHLYCLSQQQYEEVARVLSPQELLLYVTAVDTIPLPDVSVQPSQFSEYLYAILTSEGGFERWVVVKFFTGNVVLLYDIVNIPNHANPMSYTIGKFM